MDALSTLLPFDRWATLQILQSAAPLTDAQLDRPFEMGKGNLRFTLFHTIDAMHVWTARSFGEAVDPIPCDGQSVAWMIDRHLATSDRFASMVTAGSPGDPIVTIRRGLPTTLPRVGIAMHVLTHSMHHRAQVLNMLRHLGAPALPKSSVFEWMLETGMAR